MRLFDATLDLARYAQGTEQHKITSVIADNKFACSSLSARMGELTNGGTVWFLNGECEGQFGSIKRGRDQMVETEELFSNIAVGDDVAVSWFHYFNSQNLVNAINHVLYDYPIMDIYEDNTEEDPVKYKHDVYEYELPSEVGIDVRRVELQCHNFNIPFFETLPDSFTTCHYWHLNGKTLVIDPKWIYKYGGRIRIHYVKDHGPIIDKNTEMISEQVDKNYLRKMANLWLWTHEIQMKHKDNPIAVDMYNQAKMDEETLNKKNIPESRLMPKDICYFW